MTFRSKLAAAVLGGIALAVSPAAAVVASAAPTNYACDTGWFCMYHDRDGNGITGSFTDGVYDLGGWNGGRLNDHVYSVYNNTTGDYCLYSDAGHKGDSQVISPGGKVNLVDDNGNGFGARVSSAQPRGWFGC